MQLILLKKIILDKHNYEVQNKPSRHIFLSNSNIILDF